MTKSPHKTILSGAKELWLLPDPSLEKSLHNRCLNCKHWLLTWVHELTKAGEKRGIAASIFALSHSPRSHLGIQKG
jgi:hypothetical protein